jgi:methionyl aminopeptidase
VKKNGYFGDSAVTLGVGKIKKDAARLIGVTEEALYRGIKEARDGKRLFDISYAIQSYVELHGFSVVRKFVGHGIGHRLHEEPEIPNFGKPNTGVRLKSGMVFAIEPMVNQGAYGVLIKNDGWTAVTRDGKLSAHFEHTVLITPEGPDILTRGNV